MYSVKCNNLQHSPLGVSFVSGFVFPLFLLFFFFSSLLPWPPSADADAV